MLDRECLECTVLYGGGSSSFARKSRCLKNVRSSSSLNHWFNQQTSVYKTKQWIHTDFGWFFFHESKWLCFSMLLRANILNCCTGYFLSVSFYLLSSIYLMQQSNRREKKQRIPLFVPSIIINVRSFKTNTMLD